MKDAPKEGQSKKDKEPKAGHQAFSSDDVTVAPEEGAGQEKSSSVKFAETHKTDESGAPVD